MQKHKIKQHSVHANGYTINYSYSNANWRQNSGYGAYSNHTDRGSWGDGHDYGRDGGGWTNHTDYTGRHSNSGYGRYGNHSNSYSQSNYTQESSRTAQNIINNSPSLSGTPTPNSGILNRDVVTIDGSGISYSDNNTNNATEYRVYYSYCTTQNGTYDAGVLLTQTSNQSYDFTITDMPKGYYKIAVVASDGASWSALPNGNSGTYHYVNNTTAAVYVAPSESIHTISYALAGPIKIVHYDPPQWLNEYYTQAAMTQLIDATNESREAFDLTGYSFTTSNYVSNFTIITLKDFQDLDAANNETYNLYKGTDYPFNPTFPNTNTANSKDIVNTAIDDLRDLIDHLKN